jgi:adenylate cyclase class IV
MGDLTKNKLFESEVRFSIPDIDEFKGRVEALRIKLIKEYAATDYYFKPVMGEWSSLEKTLRIREWKLPEKSPVVYLTKHEVQTIGKFSFKKSVYPEGKRVLFTGSVSDCRELVTDLGFEEAYRITKKQGWVWQDLDKELEFCAEETDVFGWSGEMEIEGTDLNYIEQRIKRHQECLGIADEHLSYKPVAILIEEQLAK